MSILNTIKILLGGIEGQDELLEEIIDMTSSRLKIRIGKSADEEIPDELSFIVVEVSIIRFNKIGSEGVTSHSVEGETMAFSDDDFKGYEDDIQEWLNSQEKASKGRLRFL